MANLPLDYMDDFPRPMRRYLKYYGWHFNKAAYEFAASMMWKEDESGKRQKVTPLTKEEVDAMLKENNVELKNKSNYDYVYWAMQCKADLMPHAIEDAKHQAWYVKCMADDVDATDEAAFRCFYVKATGAGIGVPFEDFLDE